MRKFYLLIILPVFLFCFSACGKSVAPTPPAMVTQVNVVYRNGSRTIQRQYRSTEKIDQILFYLYGISSGTPAKTDPEAFLSDSCTITLILSNGENHIYRQKGSCHLSVDCRPWQRIDEKKGGRLLALVTGLPADI